jgi:hypothetical protein
MRRQRVPVCALCPKADVPPQCPTSAKVSPGKAREFPNLAAYLARGEARPAYKRAFAAQMAVNTR